MPPVFYSYIRKKKVGKDTDTVTTDIDLVDEDRKVFVSIRDYIIKKWKTQICLPASSSFSARTGRLQNCQKSARKEEKENFGSFKSVQQGILT